jgi:invasion protein IalB
MDKNIERLVTGGGALVLGLLLGWAVHGLTGYNTGTESTTVYEDWRTFCPQAKTENLSCEVMGDVVDPAAKATKARVSIVKDTKNKENPDAELIAFMVPHNVLLEAGLGLQIGKDPVKVVPYRSCNNVGCLAVQPLDDATRSALNSNTETKISFTGAQPNDKPQTFTVSFKGFSPAFSAYNWGNRRRNSAFWRMF